MKGIIEWIKDNPAKTTLLAGAGYVAYDHYKNKKQKQELMPKAEFKPELDIEKWYNEYTAGVNAIFVLIFGCFVILSIYEPGTKFIWFILGAIGLVNMWTKNKITYNITHFLNPQQYLCKLNDGKIFQITYEFDKRKKKKGHLTEQEVLNYVEANKRYKNGYPL
jgi:hypothetical protein